MVTVSPIIWFGGKSKYADEIVSFFPNYKMYVEPFGGGAHVLANKTKHGHEIYNDIDDNLVNFLMVMSEQKERLQETLRNIPYSRFLYEKWRTEPLPSDTFEKAVRWFYLNRSGVASGNNKDKALGGWRHSKVPGINPANAYMNAIEKIDIFAKRFQGVLIESESYEKIIKKYDTPNTLFYVDPPYFGREDRYDGCFSYEEHKKLAKLLSECKGKVVLSYYDCPSVRELYKGWRTHIMAGTKQVCGKGTIENNENEILFMNFEYKQLSLF